MDDNKKEKRKPRTSDPRRCPLCHHLSLRLKVNLFLDIDPRAAHRLSKTMCRTKMVQHEGAGWDTAILYCATPTCSYRPAHGY